MGHARISLAKAIEIGAALDAWKERLGHGNWMPWFQSHIKFTLRTADRYRQLYAKRDELKFDNVSNMAEAFRLLSGDKQDPTLVSTVRRREKRYSYHPLCQMLPRLDANETSAFIEDIRKNGLLHPITLFQGQILDGKLRYEACLLTGVEPEFYELPIHEDPVAYFLSLNVYRSSVFKLERQEILDKANKLRL